MVEFDDMITVLLKHEGGFTDDPKDPGNWTGGSEGKGELKGTNFGISCKAYPDEDIKGLTIERVKELYKKDYWDRYRVGQLPDRIRHIFFDMCVNMGGSRAIRVLQEACNSKNSNKIDVDGGIGRATVAASSNVEDFRVRAFRVLYYAEVIAKKPTLAKYWVGWFRRSCEV